MASCYLEWIKHFIREFDPGSGWTLAACLTHASRTGNTSLRLRWIWFISSGGRVSNAWVTCLIQGDNSQKWLLIPHKRTGPHGPVWKNSGGIRWTRVGLASWWGNGPPRRRSIAGLRGWTATLGLRHGPDSYGRQQWGILHNGGNPDAATPREGRSISVCKLLSAGKIVTVPD